jgi:hypothetical protein
MATIPSKALLLNRLVFSLLFIAMLLAPGLVSVLGAKGPINKTHTHPVPPPPDAQTLLEPEYYQAWTLFADSRLSTDNTFTRLKNWLDYHLFAMTDAQGVYVGRDGWLFDRPSINDFRKNGCSQRRHIRQLSHDLDTAARIAELSGRRVIFSVAPDKATIYPEYVGDLPREPGCHQSLYDLLMAEHEQRPIKGFVPLDRLLRDAKNDYSLLYDQTGTFWNTNGATVVAQGLLAHIFPNGSAPDTARDDLSAQVLQRRLADKSAAPALAPMPHTRQLSAAVVYGGPAMAHIMPFFTPRFDRVDLIATTTIPSANHHEDLSAYETILIMVSEPQLADLQLDLDRLCHMLAIDDAATTRTRIPLQTISAEKEVSLDIEGDRLRIKSMGAGAFFKLPPLPGSNDQTLRVLALDLIAPHGDTLSWRPEDGRDSGGTRILHSGPGRLYLPLPQKSSIRLHINAGRNAGIFELQDAVLLSFNKQPDGPQPDTYAIISPPAVEEPSSEPESPFAGSEEPTIAAEPSITLNDFEARRIFQRRGTACDITVSGAYQGQPDAIEAQVSRFDTREVIMPWTVVDYSPANGIYLGVIAGVPQGGWYRLSVRFRDRHAVMAAGQSPWAVGLLAACIGQSNMREWFYAGNDIQAHNLISVHSKGAWQKTDTLGNGATAFANRLIVYLGVPVGLLDYAVNGSGLRREADWGTGYWADRAPDSIYDRFIRGVASAGGAVEYVIWMQGEADAARKTITETQYRNTLQDFITRQVRKDIVNGSHMANLPFLVVGMPKRPVGLDEPHQAIRNALTAVTHTIDDCYLAAVTLDLQNQGHQHLAPDAYANLGRRTAQTVLYLLGKTDYYRGPSIAQAQRVNDSIIDLQLILRGGRDIEPVEGITGFQVFGPDRSPVALSRIERLTPSSIRIHLTDATPDIRRVTYLYGAMPDSQGAVHDNSALRLPLEPFEVVVE